MRLVKIKLINGKDCLLNIDRIKTLRFYSEDHERDCKMEVDGVEIGYVHRATTAENIINNLCEQFGVIELDDNGNIAQIDAIEFNNNRNIIEELWK